MVLIIHHAIIVSLDSVIVAADNQKMFSFFKFSLYLGI